MDDRLEKNYDWKDCTNLKEMYKFYNGKDCTDVRQHVQMGNVPQTPKGCVSNARYYY